ncbi:hypothetical protein D3C85_1727690 [compost metagenome]
MNGLVGAQARGGEELTVGGAVDGIGVLAMVETNDVFFINLAHGTYIDPLIGHGVFSC